MASLREYTIHKFKEDDAHGFVDNAENDSYQFDDASNANCNNDYNLLKNKPKLNGKELIGDTKLTIKPEDIDGLEGLTKKVKEIGDRIVDPPTAETDLVTKKYVDNKDSKNFDSWSDVEIESIINAAFI